MHLISCFVRIYYNNKEVVSIAPPMGATLVLGATCQPPPHGALGGPVLFGEQD